MYVIWINLSLSKMSSQHSQFTLQNIFNKDQNIIMQRKKLEGSWGGHSQSEATR